MGNAISCECACSSDAPAASPVILENQDVLEAAVFLEVENAIAESPEHILDPLGWKVGQAGVVVRSFDDDLMRPNAVHAVEHALGLAVQIALDAECRKLVGNHAHRPARSIALGRRPAVGVGAVGLDLRRSLGFVAVTEGAEAASDFDRLAGEVGRTLGAVGRNNDPAAHDRIFSKLRQLLKSLSVTRSVTTRTKLFYSPPFLFLSTAAQKKYFFFLFGARVFCCYWP